MSSIKKGDVVAVSTPFACVLLSGVRGERCETCLKSCAVLRKCTQCNLAHYCNAACQKSSWKEHRAECKSLKKVHPRLPSDYILLLARIIRRLKRGGDAETEKIGDVTRTFASLVSHSPEIQVDPERREIFAVSYVVLAQFLDEDELPPADLALEILGKIFINTITILDEQDPVALGLYLGPSALNHSCAPNLTVVFNGPTLTLRSLEDLPELDVAKTFINYIDLLDSTANRRKQLQEQFYFLCECPACLDEERDRLMHSYKCPNDACEHPVQSHRGERTCGNCGTAVSAERMRRAGEIMKSLEEKTEIAIKLKKEDCAEAKDAIEGTLCEARRLLHPLNVHLIKGLDEFFDTHVRLRDLETALEHGLLTLPGFKKYIERTQAAYGLQLAKIGKIQLALNKIEDAKRSLVEANKHLSFWYDKEHPVYDRFRRTLMDLKEAIDTP